MGMEDMTWLGYWRMMGPAGKVYVLFIGTILTVALLRIGRSVFATGRRCRLVLVGRWLEKAAISAAMFGGVNAGIMALMFLRMERESSYLLGSSLSAYLRILTTEFFVSFVLFVLGWWLSSIPPRSKHEANQT